MSLVVRAGAIGILLAAAGTPAAAQGFEGVVVWQMGTQKRELTQVYRGSSVRTEMAGAGGAGAVIADHAAGTMVMLMPEQKMYMRRDLAAMGAGMRRDSAPAPGAKPRITATGKTETIAGRTCEVYRVEPAPDRPEVHEICAAKGMGYFMAGGGGTGGRRGGGGMPGASVAADPSYAKTFKDGFFPLRITRIAGGKSEVVMLALKVDPRAVDPALFQVPSGYTEMEMPSMPGMPPRP